MKRETTTEELAAARAIACGSVNMAMQLILQKKHIRTATAPTTIPRA